MAVYARGLKTSHKVQPTNQRWTANTAKKGAVTDSRFLESQTDLQRVTVFHNGYTSMGRLLGYPFRYFHVTNTCTCSHESWIFAK